MSDRRGTEALGIHVEGNEVRIARIRWDHKTATVEALVVGELPELLAAPPVREMTADAFAGAEDVPEVSFTADQGAGNGSVLWELIERAGGHPRRVGISFTDTEVSYHLLPHQAKNQLRKSLQELARTAAAGETGDAPREARLLASTGEHHVAMIYNPRPQVLELVLGIQEMMKGQRFRLEVLTSAELMLAQGAAKAGQDREGLTAVVHAGPTFTRVILVRDGSLVRILLTLNEGLLKPGLLDRLLGRLSLLRDEGELTGLSQLLLAGDFGLDAVDVFQREFTDLHVALLQLDELNHDPVPEEVWAKAPGWIIPICLALAALGKHAQNSAHRTNFLPEEVRQSQKRISIRWYHLAMLALMFCTSLALMQRGMEAHRLTQRLTVQVAESRQAVKEWQIIVTELEKVHSQIKGFETYMSKYNSASVDMIEWTKLLDDLTKSVRNTNSLWIREMTCREDGFLLTGYALVRQRIADLAAQFSDAEVEKVLRTVRSENTVYEFQIKVGRPQRPADANQRRAEMERQRNQRSRNK